MKKLLHRLRSDEALMLAFQSGDAGAFEVLYQRHSRSLLRFLLNLGRGSGLSVAKAEEMSQDIWMSLIERADAYQALGSPASSPRFVSYLFTVARNRWIDQYRKQRVRSHIEVDVHPIDGAEGGNTEHLSIPVEGGQVSSLDCQRLLQAVDRLPQDQRLVFVLKEEGFSMAEIARQLDQPEETVKSRLRYARNKLRQEFESPTEKLSVTGEV